MTLILFGFFLSCIGCLYLLRRSEGKHRLQHGHLSALSFQQASIYKISWLITSKALQQEKNNYLPKETDTMVLMQLLFIYSFENLIELTFASVANHNISSPYIYVIRFISYNICLIRPVFVLGFLFFLEFLSHYRFIYSFGYVTITGEGLQILTYIRHSWSFSSEVFFLYFSMYHTYCYTGQLFVMVISEDP